ncbi:major facilitator superfamily domain-containing protein [Xylaria bambusicola]|uniref:major facilitator superfamily domain-containing protein n=1 Tax=Xylaria bambusicola TaxID=326684 RepID=UPI002007CCCB|nr:major facilitator superfamily domain-containing protein [Xylaria bambusicola]KAI0521927.1 major facilitator superfamily domain-containing protein [Xylaria bambusicola]
MSTDQHTMSSGQVSAEKAAEIGRETDAPQVERMPKHVVNADPDEALKLVAAHAGESIVLTPEEQKRLLRKIDLHLMPFLCIVYGLNYLDKTTLSYASIVGFKTDLNIGVSEYNWVASIFYFGYLVWEWPTNWLLQRLPLAKYSAFNVILWGSLLTILASVKNFAGALAVRFFLGAAEAAVSPGFVLFTSQWYTTPEQGTRVPWWFSFNGWGQIVGGVVAYGIATADDSLSIHGWQLIFIVFGLFTVLMGVGFLYWMPDSQLNARFLTEHERLLAVERIRVNQQGVGNKHFKWYQCKEAFTDPLVWSFVLFSFFANIPNGGITNYFSQLIVAFGFTPKQSLLLGVPGGAVQVITLITFGHLGRKLNNRLLVNLIGPVLAILGLFLIRFLPTELKGGRLAGYYLYSSGSTGFVCILSLISSNIAGWTKKTTAAAMYLISYCVGNLIGPQVFRPGDAPTYYTAITVILVSYILAVLTMVFIYIWCRRLNAINAAVRAAPGYTKVEDQEFMDLTDRENPEFVYEL